MDNLFFELLQVSLGTRDKLTRVPSAREWDALYDEAGRQAVVGVLLGGLERLPEEQLPPLEVKLQWIGESQIIEATGRTHRQRVKELADKLRSVGFRSCILKGIGVAEYYPEPLRRQCGDIDIWVDGHHKDILAWMRSEYELAHVEWNHIGAEIFDDAPVEIHLHPSWLYNPRYNSKLQKFFEYYKADAMLATKNSVNYPSIAFEAVFSLIHSFHHLLEEGVGFRHVIDYYYILKQLSDNQRSEAFSFLMEIGVGRYAAAMMYVLQDICGLSKQFLLCKPNVKEGKFLLDEIVASGNFGFSRRDDKGRNTASRWLMMVKHYPHEALWMIPWKCWHNVWKRLI